MTDQQQLDEWVAGRPKCPNDQGECCPDFSCCRPKLLRPREEREAFRDADTVARDRMLMTYLEAMLEDEGHTVV